jgi:hypothetical protein
MPSSPGIGMHVEVKDPDDKVVLSRVMLNIFLKIFSKLYFNLKDVIYKFHYLLSRCIALKAGSLSPPTHLVNMSFVCIQTVQSGFLEHNW